jgi:nucleotide-binding universal stress UspA family protein
LRNGHDLVVKCPESPDWLDRLFSGDDMHLLRKCPCPVWMIRPEVGESYQRILAAVDVDDSYPPEELETRRALNSTVMELAGSLAVSEFAELHVVNVWRAMFENTLRHSAFLRKPEDEVDAYVEQVRRDQAQRLDELMRETGAKLGPDAMDYIKPQLHLLKGEAREEIPALAKRLQVDCIIMGTVARTGIRGFIMGNTAETILDQIDCSVLAIKPPGFVTPVELEE